MIADVISSMLWSKSQPKNATIENPALSLQDPRTWDELLAGTESDAGVRVTHATALSIGAVWQSVSTISGDVATATLNIYRTEDDGDMNVDLDHDAQYLISVQPNDEMSAFEFWRRYMVHALLWQDAYAFVLREGRSSKGRVTDILNLLPDRTKPVRYDDGTLYYVSEIDGELEPFRADEIIHTKGLSVDPSKGMDLVEKAKNSFGLSLAAEGFGSRFFKNGTQSGGILEIPASMTEKAKQVLEEGFSRKYAGKDNWFKTVILRDGAKFNATTIDAQKSQMHELREDQVRETARFFNLPPFKLGLSDSVSYNSQEQAQIVYLTGCLNHWFSAIRGECNIKLLSLNERKSGKWKCRHDVSELLKTDQKTHTDVVVAQLTATIINPDEARQQLGYNKRADGQGHIYGNPNTTPGPAATPESDDETPANEPGGGQGDDPGNDPDEGSQALKELFQKTVDRVARRVCFDARNAAKKPATFAKWIDGKAFEHRDIFAEQVKLVVRVIDMKNADSLTVALDGKFFSLLIDDLSPLLNPPYSANDLSINVDGHCSDFEETIAKQLTELVFAKDTKCVQAA